MDDPRTPRQRLLARKAALWSERSSWVDHWRDISEHMQPRLGRFFVDDSNDGKKRHQKVYDNAAIFAARTLASGMMSGMTSPARPWFRLALADRDLMEFAAVKQWLHQVSELMRAVFSSSNTYRALHSCYEELGLFGCWADVVLPDFDTVIHHYPLTIGEYALATDERGQVDTLAREFRMTVGQLVGQFGLDACSASVRSLWDRGAYDQWVPVMHTIQPRRHRDMRTADARNKRFESIYMELGCNEEKFLRESGFSSFPALCPRWAVTGNDVYGHSPAMDCLGDVRQLMHGQLRKAQALDYKVNPPLQAPAVMKNQAGWRLPGGIGYYDNSGPNAGVRSAFDVNIDLSHQLEDIADMRQRINSGFFADLFLMMASMPGVQPRTAEEIAERHEEKLLMLGPVLERLQNELLSPLVDITFAALADATVGDGRGGVVPLLPPPPQEMQGMDLKVEFVSVLAQAQRAVSAGSIDRLLSTVGQISAAKGDPSPWDKVDTDRVIDEYAEVFGTNPELVRSADAVEEMRAQRAQQQAAQQATAAAEQLAGTAKTASEIDVDNVQNIMAGLQGYNT